MAKTKSVTKTKVEPVKATPKKVEPKAVAAPKPAPKPKAAITITKPSVIHMEGVHLESSVMEPPTPELGKKYIFSSQAGEFIAELNEGGLFGHTMTIHEVKNGVQTERTIDMPDASVYTFVDDKDEIFRRLAMA